MFSGVLCVSVVNYCFDFVVNIKLMWIMKYSKKLLLCLALIGCTLLTYNLYLSNSSLTADQQKQLAALLQVRQSDSNFSKEIYEQDINLLTIAHTNDPHNEHYPFYLAIAYKALNNFDEAIKWSKIRLEQQGDREEVWYSKFLLGQCYQEKGDWDKSLHWYLEAYLSFPVRAEPLHKIANYFRVNGKNDLAYKYAKQGSLIPYPGDDALFITKPVYDYQFDEELYIAAYYTKFKDEGFAAAERLILNKKAPAPIKEHAYKNLLFYIENLKSTHFFPIKFNLPYIREGYPETYNPLNPSIQKTADGYKVLCRTVNYIRTKESHYIYPDPNERCIRTKNFLIYYDKDFNLISQHEIIENLEREHHCWVNIIGLEDCRLIPSDQNTSFTCTICDTSPQSVAQISYCSLGKQTPGNPIYVEKLTPMKGPNPNRWEKNWLPFLVQNEIYSIYTYDPFVINKLNIETGDSQIVYQYDPIRDFSRFRGSAGPIPFDNGYLVMVHEAIYSHQLNYLHRFLYLDKNFKVRSFSKPFTFSHLGIEFGSGMTVDHTGKQLIMTIGVEDHEAYFYFVDLDTVRNMLEPLTYSEDDNMQKSPFNNVEITYFDPK